MQTSNNILSGFITELSNATYTPHIQMTNTPVLFQGSDGETGLQGIPGAEVYNLCLNTLKFINNS